MSVRVPTPVVSLSDVTLLLKKDATIELNLNNLSLYERIIGYYEKNGVIPFLVSFSPIICGPMVVSAGAYPRAT